MAELGRFAPSGRSVVVGVVLLVLGVGGYTAARETGVFAVRRIEVTGGTPTLRAQVRSALAGESGQSLLRVDGSVLGRRLAGLAGLRSFDYDRAFPHTLRIDIRPERPLLLVRQGRSAYLVSASGRVVRSIARPRASGLPRLWLRQTVRLAIGGRLTAPTSGAAAALVALQGASLPGGVRTVRVAGRMLTLELGDGVELRLGDAGDLRLKLAIARRILRTAVPGPVTHSYLDVSLPERPVLGPNPAVEGRG